ncbi:hypothetical protein LPJ70_000450 [Coemansia sp. RSA 2708]|nr:hypothetical protein LPJ70_000450 [Coemansia sp. RSA 2708]
MPKNKKALKAQRKLKAKGSFYELGAKVLERLEQREGSIKSLTVGNSKMPDDYKRNIYALICQTLKLAPVLTRILDSSEEVKKLKFSRQMLLLLTHDLLFAKGGLWNKGADPNINRTIRPFRKEFMNELDKIRQEMGAKCDEDLVPEHLRNDKLTFRYVRVNTLVWTTDKVVEHFVKDSYELVAPSRDEMRSALEVNTRRFMRDLDMNDVLVFPPGTDLHAHRTYVVGAIILQDKGSCAPAHVVQPAPGSTVLDACAAPGNKTSHMASLMGNKGKIFAFDKNQSRLDTLVNLTDKAKCKIIEAKCADFLELDPLAPEYADVERVLLDPSCSGSGIVNRLDELVDWYIAMITNTAEEKPKVDTRRLQSLAEFQTLAIRHAMRFPGVKRISYSTCSVHEEENEAVVARVLEGQHEFALAPADQMIPSWPRRGLVTAGLTKEQAASMVRMLPEDGSNGFFVACFERQAPADLDRIRSELHEAKSASNGSAAPTKSAKDADAKKTKRKHTDGSKGDAKAHKQKRAKPAQEVVPTTKNKGKKRPKRKVSVADA